MTTRIEVAGRVSCRRRWTVEQKLATLRDAFGPEGSVRAACDRHEQYSRTGRISTSALSPAMAFTFSGRT